MFGRVRRNGSVVHLCPIQPGHLHGEEGELRADADQSPSVRPERARHYRALIVGATTSECEPPQIRHPHLLLARDRGIVKPRPRKWAGNLGAAASGLSISRHVGTRVAHGGAAPNGLIDPPSGASSPQTESPDSRDSSPEFGFSDSSPRSPLDFGLDIGAQINIFTRGKQTGASTTASLDLLAPLAGLSCGQTSADLIDHLEQLVLCH
jgi:hypothetical protein